MTPLRIELDLDDGDLPAKMERNISAVQKFQSKIHDTSSSIRRMEDSSKSLLATMRDITIVASQAERAFGMLESVSTSWVHKIVEVNAEFERMVMVMRALSTASDPIKEATQKVTELREEARNAPFSLQAIHLAMTRLSAASLGTKENMLALTDAVAAFGGTDSELNRASLAFQEMSGKGVVQMKELRNQLMMAIPSAGTLIARAFGESYEQVMSDIHSGTVDAKTTINGLMLEFERAFGGDAQRQMTTFNGLMGQTRVLLQSIAVEDVGQPTDKMGNENPLGFFAEVKTQMRDFNAFLETNAAHVIGQDLGTGLKSVVIDLRTAIDYAIEFKDELKMAAEGLAIGFAIKAAFATGSSIKNIGAGLVERFTDIGGAWRKAMIEVEGGSTTTALKRIEVLKTQATGAALALEEARERSLAASQLAEGARMKAQTAPSAGIRTEAEQADLDMKAARAHDRLKSELLNKQTVEARSWSDAQQRIADREVQARAAREKHEDVYTDPKSSEKKIADSSIAVSNAQAAVEIERLRSKKIALEEIDVVERKVNAARVTYEQAEANRVSAPVAKGRDATEQAALNLAAIKANKIARAEEDAAEIASIRSINAAKISAMAEAEGTGSRLGRAYSGIKANLPVIASGLSMVATWAPIAAIAIGFIAEEFDIFNTHAKEAWQNLEHYGASSLEAAEGGKAYLKQLEDEIKALKEKQALAKQSEAYGFQPGDEGNFGKSAAGYADEAIATQDLLNKKTAEYTSIIEKQALLAEGVRYSRREMATVDLAFQDIQLRYNRESNEAAKAHSATVERLAKAHRSTLAETVAYQETQKNRALKFYDEEIAGLDAYIEKQQKARDDSKDDMLIQAQTAKALEDALAKRMTLATARDKEKEQDMGLFKHTKPMDDAKLLGNAEQQIASLRAAVEGAKAGIEGSDAAAEQLYERWLQMGKAGDKFNESVRETLQTMKETKEAADDLNKIQAGGHKLEKDLQDEINKNNEILIKSKYGKLSRSEQIDAMQRDGVYAGFGGDTPEQRRLTALREEIDRNKIAALGLQGAFDKLFSAGWVSNVDRAAGSLEASGNALVKAAEAMKTSGGNSLLSVMNGTTPILGGGPAAAAPSGGAPSANWDKGFTFGNAGPGSAQTSPNDPLGSDVKRALENLAGAYGNFTVTSTTEGKHAPGSEHYKNEAVDISTRDMSEDDYSRLIQAAAASGFKRFGISNTHLHADMGTPANGYAQAFSDDGATTGRAGKSVDEWTAALTKIVQASPRASLSGRTDTPMIDEVARLKAEGRRTEAEAKVATANDAIKALSEKFKSKDFAEALEAAGAGKNYATAVAAIKEHGNETSAHSTDEKNPAFKELLDNANKKDKSEADLKDLRERTTAGASAEKTNREKLKSSADELHNSLLRLSHSAGAYSDTVLKEIDQAKQRTAQVLAAHNGDEKNPAVIKARADESAITSAEIDKGIVGDVESAQKKTIALREATMTQEQADADRVQKLREHYALDLANFRGTEEDKARLAKILNDHVDAEQAALAAKTPFAKEMQQWADVTKNMQQNMATFATSGVDALTTYIVTGKNQWRQLRDTMVKDLTGTAIKGALGGLMNGSGLGSLLGGGAGKAGAPMALAGAMSGGGGAAKGASGVLGMFAGVHHAGGLVGSEGSSRFLTASSLFHQAPRFHSGGISGDEVPIIAQRGEGVFTKGQMKAMGGAASRSTGEFHLHNNVTVNSNGGDAAQNADLAKQVAAHVDRMTRATVLDEMLQQMRPGNILSSDPSNVFGRA